MWVWALMGQCYGSAWLVAPAADLDKVKARPVLVVVALLVTAACGSGTIPGTAGGTTTTPEPRVDSVESQLRAIVGEDGEVTKDEALRAFAATIGPVPGYENQRPVEPAGDELVLGDMALRWVAARADELTDAERDAVLAVLEGGADLPPTRGRSRSATSVDRAQLQRWAEEFVRSQGAAFGRTLSTDVTVRIVNSIIGDGFAATDAVRGLLARDADGDLVVGDTCLIQVGPNMARRDAGAQRSMLAHEVFHCFQYDVFGDEVVHRAPEWWHEGAAAWVGLVFGGEHPMYAPWWDDYLRGRSGEWALAGSSYSAVGFWGSLSSSGVDVNGVLRAIFDRRATTAGAMQGVIESFLGDSGVVAQFGPSPARRSGWGRRWVPGGPGVAASRARREPHPVSVDGSQMVTAPSEGNSVSDIIFVQQGAVVVTMEGTGFGAYRWGDRSVDLNGDASGRWCGQDPCLCPDGSPVPGGPYERIPGGQLVVGLAGFGARQSALTFTVRSISELCSPTTTIPSGPGPTATLSGQGGGTYSEADGEAYCTAEQSGGAWVLSIGRAPGRYFSLAIASIPTGPGPIGGAGLGWGEGPTTAYGSDQNLRVTFNADLKSGTFAGTGLDPSVLPVGRFPIEGTFDCGNGGDPPGTAAPWRGR